MAEFNQKKFALNRVIKLGVPLTKGQAHLVETDISSRCVDVLYIEFNQIRPLGQTDQVLGPQVFWHCIRIPLGETGTKLWVPRYFGIVLELPGA